jgi:flagellar hook-associated protein 3 FlgL
MTTVSSLGQSNLIRAETSQLQGQINRLQEQITSGQKAQAYGDLGAQAPLDISLRNEAESTDAIKTSLSFLSIRTSVVDQSLNAIHDTALNLHSLTVKNLGFDAGRQDIINEAQTAVSQITQKLQANVDGRFLFGGTQTGTSPVVSDTTLLAQVRAAINTALTAVPAPANIPAAIQTAVHGVFATTSNYYNGGAPYAPTQIESGLKVDTSITANDPSIQQVLEGAYTIAALDMPVDDPATLPAIDRTDFDATVRNAADTMFSGLTGTENLISKNGRNQALISNAEDHHNATLTLLQTQINNIEQVDLADASTRITQLQTQLQASFQLTAQLRGLSLVNFLT